MGTFLRYRPEAEHKKYAIPHLYTFALRVISSSGESDIGIPLNSAPQHP